MDKDERNRYNMFARVRDFGAANRHLFPEFSLGGRQFAAVAAAVARIEDGWMNLDSARIRCSKIKPWVLDELRADMKTLARTARLAIGAEHLHTPFVLPTEQSYEALLTRARGFIDMATPLEPQLRALGLPDTFLDRFRQTVAETAEAIDQQTRAHADRAIYRKAVAQAIDDGFAAVRMLDVIVPNLVRGDAVRTGQWAGARHLDGVRSRKARRLRAAAKLRRHDAAMPA